MRILRIVVIKLIAPNIDDAPAKCNANIAISTDGPACPNLADNGGYMVQPVPAPEPIVAETINNTTAGTKTQKLKLFKRGKAMSGAPIIRGINQFPKPPIKAGITTKKTISSPWAVIITFQA